MTATTNGHAATNGHSKESIKEHGTQLSTEPKTGRSGQPETEKLVVNTVRCLGADLCQQFKGGHPGTVMGAATIGVALWRYHMRYNPRNPDWFDRDRFVLSAGHACLLQYIFLHLSGYEAWTLDEVKKYHAPVKHNMAAGHPEIEFPGIEVTTGPLGQGIANAVGLAVAAKSLGANFNKEGHEVIGSKIWCFTGDGCIQEGIGQEAISLAGHWGLDNLILIYDNNAVTVDGSIDNCFTEDTSAKLQTMGWNVIDVYDGSNDLNAVNKAMEQAKAFRGKPTCINIRTIIGIGSLNQGKGKVHGQALGEDDVAQIKSALGFDPFIKFSVPDDVYEYFSECQQKGADLETAWNDKLDQYAKAYPEDYAELTRRRQGQLRSGWQNDVPAKSALPTAAQPTRKSSGIMIQALASQDKTFMVGSADILESTFVSWEGMTEFQNPKSKLGDYAGRQIRYGIREHAMVAIGNGMGAYQKGMFLPVMSTFFMFWLYAAPAARMSALQKLRFIGIATHDSIGIGEDGPTHQPIALAAFYRALPNLNLIRPCDAEEVIGAWLVALEATNTPSIFALSRQPVPLLPGTSRDGVARGGYAVHETQAGVEPVLTLLATGAEVARAVEVANALGSNYNVRVVSLPCLEIFDRQTGEYRASVIPSETSLVVAIEAWASFGWARYAHAGLHMHTFGMSAPQEKLYEIFGFSVDSMVDRIGKWVEGKREGKGYKVPGVGRFEELLLGITE